MLRKNIKKCRGTKAGGKISKRSKGSKGFEAEDAKNTEQRAKMQRCKEGKGEIKRMESKE